eukprot:TRINITY_DN5565_c0_g2_i2.p1 TRINITY_DN5565_c0_g2~~TRINITY_DN5565_c0_g2_i2.p1  ORF type:complete len:275 (-),score=66.65 TRINITY_DN5565_c0_g2_i2:52-876(-)
MSSMGSPLSFENDAEYFCWDLIYFDILKELEAPLDHPSGEVQVREQEQDQLQMNWNEQPHEEAFIMEDDPNLHPLEKEMVRSPPPSPKKRSSPAHPKDRASKHPKMEVNDKTVSQEIENSNGLHFLRGYMRYITGIEKEGHRAKLPLNTDSPRRGRNNLYNKILSDDSNAVVDIIESSVWTTSENWRFELQKIDDGFAVWECTKCPKRFYLQFKVRVSTEEEQRIGSVVVGPLQSFRSKPTKDCDRNSIAQSKMFWDGDENPLKGHPEWMKTNL